MDAPGLVRQDHRRLEALLERLERADLSDAEERTVLLAQLNTALRHHVDEEESLLYPAYPLPDRDLPALLDLGRRLEDRKHVVAGQEALETTTSDLLRSVRLRLTVAVTATAAVAIIFAITRHHRRGKRP